MNHRRFGRLLAATTVTSLTLSGVTVADAQTDPISVSVTNFTDLHGYLVPGEIGEDDTPEDIANTPMGAVNLEALMSHVELDNDVAFRTTSGDNVGGSAFVSASQNDEPMLDALNAMSIDASAVGNHEFDQGWDDLLDRIVPRSDYPILGANVIVDETGKTLLDPSTVIEREGIEIGFVGTVTVNTVAKSAPSSVEGLTFTDPVEAANKEAKRLKDSGEADVVVVLQHEGIRLTNGFDFDYVDAVFGGDTHTRELDGQLAQAHEYGKVLNELEFDYDPATDEASNFVIKQYDYNTILELGEDTLATNPEVVRIVEAAEAQADEIGKEVITTIENPYLRGSNPGAGAGSNRGTESTANNMLADAAKYAMEKAMGRKLDLGVMNAGGVRSDLAAGEVQYEDVATMQPFGNSLNAATISGAGLIKALENQWQPGKERPRLSMGLSNNVSYTYDPKAEQGERIIAVYIDGEKVDPAKDYTFAAASFLMDGGDGFLDVNDIKDVRDVGYLDLTAFADYLKAEGNPVLRSGQSDVGVHFPQGVTFGESNTIELSSLNYSTEGEPMAKTVTVTAGDQEVTADIDNEVTQADKGFGEQGRATVELTIPEDVKELVITTDAGTEVIVPLAEVGKHNGDPSRNGSSDSQGSSDAQGSSRGALIGGGIAAAIFALLDILGFGWLTNAPFMAPVKDFLASLS